MEEVHCHMKENLWEKWREEKLEPCEKILLQSLCRNVVQCN
jgi:hypothetical protein